MFDLARPIWEQKTGLYIATAVHRWVWAMLTCILLWYLGWKIWMATTNIKLAKTEKMGNQLQVDPALQNRSVRTLALHFVVCSLCLCLPIGKHWQTGLNVHWHWHCCRALGLQSKFEL